MTPDDFIAELSPLAAQSEKANGIPASFIIAEGALESGWGTSALYVEDNNLFGVKADASWKGATVTRHTRERLRGVWVSIPALWRAYPNLQACMDDHDAFFHDNPRYHLALGYPNNGIKFAREVARAGYATDPRYAMKIISIIEAHKL